MSEDKIESISKKEYPFLSSPKKITEQDWDEQVAPLVSIDCRTYMHENYIRDAIEGFLMQQTTFKVEILIHEDASTDKTAGIIKEYETKYPKLIKPTYQVENQYKKTPKTDKYIKPYPKKGKYIAKCEGDDYWTDPLKLQKQVEFMEKNPDYVMCYHKNQQKKGDTLLPGLIPAKGKDFTGDELIATPTGIATATKLYRNVSLKHPNQNRPTGDYGLNAYLGLFGKCKFISNIKPSVRRLHSGGAWTSKHRDEKHYGLINTKINIYKFFRSQNDHHRSIVALRALRDAIDKKLVLLDPNYASSEVSMEMFRIVFRGVELKLYYKPFFIFLKRKIKKLFGRK